MVILSKLGLCPPLFGKFKNGLAYGCIPGKVFKVSDMRDPHKMNLVAKKLAIWHGTVEIPGERTSKLFKTIHKWIKEGILKKKKKEIKPLNCTSPHCSSYISGIGKKLTLCLESFCLSII
jgi:hypothetical protein